MNVKKQHLLDAYFIVSLTLFTGAILTLLGEALGTASPEGDPVQRAVYLLVYVLMIPLLIVNHKAIYRLLIKEKIISIVLLISILSVTWSALPFITIRRIIALLLTTLYAVLFAHHYKLEDQIRIMAYSFGLIVIMCMIYPILFPEMGIHEEGTHEGLWRGVFVQKNAMASILILSIMVLTYKLMSAKKNRLGIALLIAISFLLIVLSWSTTALLSLFLVYLSVRLFKFYAKLNKRNVIINISFLFAFLSILMVYLLNNLSTIFNLFGKDLTLSGRIPLWFILINSSQDKLLLGYGYGAYWNGLGSPSTGVLSQLMWVPNDAHNGYIDIVLGIGIVGLVFIIFKIMDIFISTKVLYNISRETKYLLIISIIVYILLLNITSTSILKQNSIFWIVLVSISTGLRKEYIRHRDGHY